MKGCPSTPYVLGYFGKTVRSARKAYLSFMEKGIAPGRREDLTGGGLIRNVGGWDEIKRLKQKSHVMSDERILGALSVGIGRKLFKALAAKSPPCCLPKIIILKAIIPCQQHL
jgi:hypothetical protein